MFSALTFLHVNPSQEAVAVGALSLLAAYDDGGIPPTQGVDC